MGKRRKARESTLQILFQLEFDTTKPEKVFESFWKNKKATKEIKEHSRRLVDNITLHRKDIDHLIQSVSANWRISRMAIVDRNILRIAVCELLYEESIAPAIIINEAIEVAKKYSSENGATFVNGILDAVRKEIQAMKKAPEDEKDV
ncbi:MAG: transcription antitermination factor NusB [Candidatus Aminicenantes bacterium]|nr:MAG: transcription antitermination factor NusB [Candidatus Aminicenantes bacterium]